MAANMRMNKSGTFSPSAFTVNMITGWVADPGSPATNIVSNQLKATAPGAGITVSGACVWTATFSGSVSAQLYKNGVAFGSVQTVSASSGTFTFSHTGQSVAVNDTWDMRIQDSSNVGVVVQVAGTFLRIDGYIDPPRSTPMHAVMRASLY